MRTRTLPLLGAALALLSPAPARADGPTASLAACHRALDPADRYLTVEGAMDAAPGSSGMEMRFDLYRRWQGAAAFSHVPAPRLGVYKHAPSGVGQYRFRKTIRNLPAPADYRVTITFRWHGPDGGVLAQQTRSAPLCHESDQRPDLRVAAIDTVAKAAADRATYRVTIHNGGGSAAGGFAVALSIGSARVGPVVVERLGAGERRTVSFSAPACTPGQALVASVDSRREVQEASESNNTRGATCPSLH